MKTEQSSAENSKLAMLTEGRKIQQRVELEQRFRALLYSHFGLIVLRDGLLDELVKIAEEHRAKT